MADMFEYLPIKAIMASAIMTKEVITVTPETPFTEAAKILVDNRLEGLPVLDEKKKLVGIFTQYDFINIGSEHIPTLEFIFGHFTKFKTPESLPAETRDITSLKVGDVMNKEPLTFLEEATFKDIIMVFRNHHRVNPVPVVNDKHEVVGVISRIDILKPFRIL